MEHVGNYSHKVTTQLSYDDAIEKVTGLLKEQGFGILTEIDVKATLKEKIDVDYKPYKILGACNPPFAHKALEAEQMAGVFLPCNVVVWDEGDHRVVTALDARIMGNLMDDPTIREIAEEVNGRVTKALSALE